MNIKYFTLVEQHQ